MQEDRADPASVRHATRAGHARIRRKVLFGGVVIQIRTEPPLHFLQSHSLQTM